MDPLFLDWIKIIDWILWKQSSDSVFNLSNYMKISVSRIQKRLNYEHAIRKYTSWIWRWSWWIGPHSFNSDCCIIFISFSFFNFHNTKLWWAVTYYILYRISFISPTSSWSNSLWVFMYSKINLCVNLPVLCKIYKQCILEELLDVNLFQ